MNKPLSLDAQYVREVLDFDPNTGDFHWRVDLGTSRRGQIAGGLSSKGYIQIGVGGRTISAHRLAWIHVYGAWPTNCIDHINGIKSDNRISNLRDVEHRVNMQNKRRASGKNKSSGLIGAWRESGSKRWVSRITVDQKRIFLGSFGTAEEAHSAYVGAKRRLHEGCTL